MSYADRMLIGVFWKQIKSWLSGIMSSGGGGNSGAVDGNGIGGSGETDRISKPQTITVSSVTKTYGSKPFSLKAKTSGNGKINYKCSNKKTAVISKCGKVTVKGYGKSVVTVKAKKTPEYREAVKKITVHVIPKKVSITKTYSPESRKVVCNWRRDRTVDGYEVYLSRKSDFLSQTFKRVFKSSVTNMSLVGLESNKTYYIRMRSYKKVGEETCYGIWSKVKKVKVK